MGRKRKSSPFLWIVIYFLISGVAANAAGDASPDDMRITLSVRNVSLWNALNKIAAATGYHISLDETWRREKVSVSFSGESLHEGLKRTLGNRNSVIVYGPGRNIKIQIFDKTAGKQGTGIREAREPLPRAPVPGSPSYRIPNPPPPAARTLDHHQNTDTGREAYYPPGIPGSGTDTIPPAAVVPGIPLTGAPATVPPIASQPTPPPPAAGAFEHQEGAAAGRAGYPPPGIPGNDSATGVPAAVE